MPTIKNLWLILVVAFLCSAFVSAQAELPEDSGNALMRQCAAIDKDHAQRTSQEFEDTMVCLTYVSAFVQGMEYGVELAGTKVSGRPFCLPDRVEHGQTVRIVLKYIQDHPKESQKATPFLIVLALHKAYPCK